LDGISAALNAAPMTLLFDGFTENVIGIYSSRVSFGDA
jgi:hypothetical protein